MTDLPHLSPLVLDRPPRLCLGHPPPVFSQNISRAIRVANFIHAGTLWVNCYNMLNSQVPFVGFKSSGIGRELGEYALANTSVKAVHINLSAPGPL
jgi:aldehyde dehydrogenase (NAD+)